jgi:hypothetical protein
MPPALSFVRPYRPHIRFGDRRVGVLLASGHHALDSLDSLDAIFSMSLPART